MHRVLLASADPAEIRSEVRICTLCIQTCGVHCSGFRIRIWNENFGCSEERNMDTSVLLDLMHAPVLYLVSYGVYHHDHGYP